MTVRIRAANPADLAATRDLLVATWHDTYDALIGAAKVTERTDRWHGLGALAEQARSSDASFLVADAGEDGIVGHAFGHARRPPVLAVARLYVLATHQRRGIGGRLLAALVAGHLEATAVRLTVEAANLKGVAFYRREGFVAVGKTDEDGLVGLLMEKTLIGPAQSW